MTQRAHPQIPEVPVVDKEVFQEFVQELKGRKAIRQVLVDDEGLVEPARRGSAIVMQPKVRIVATAYDPEAGQIIRWQHKYDVGSDVVTLHGTAQKGTHRDVNARLTKEDVTGELQIEQYQVTAGEWTPQSVTEILDRRRRRYGSGG